MRLVACQNCHTQYDVTEVADDSFACRCGEKVANESFDAVDVAVHRCGSCGAHVSSDADGCDFCGSEIVRDDSQLSLICPECHGRNAEVSSFCTACGVAFAPETVKVEGYELPCPACGVLMPPRSIGGIGINECGTCNGVWAPENRLDQLINRAIDAQRQNGTVPQRAREPRTKAANPFSQRVAYRKCPDCDAFMQRRNFRKTSGVIIDRCYKHGTWLDADELEQITAYVLSGGNPVADAIMDKLDKDARKAAAGAQFSRTLAETQWAGPSRSQHSLGGLLAGGFVSVLKGILD